MMHMKRTFLSTVCTLLVLAALVCPVVSAAADGTQDRVISTQASAQLQVTPDRAQATCSVQTENADVKVAQAANAVTMDGVINALVNAGINRSDIRTTGYSIYPVYDDTTPLPFGQKVKYYRVTNSVQVTIRDITRTGEIIDIAVGAGANSVDSVNFMVSEEMEQAYRAQVLASAVKKARADADTIAAAAGVTITGVQQISSQGYYAPVISDTARYAAGAEAKSAAVPTPVEPGQVTISAQVSASYLIG